MAVGNNMKHLKFLFFIFLINTGISFADKYQGVWVCNWFDLQNTSTQLYSWGKDICVKDECSFYIDNTNEKNIFYFSDFGIYSYNSSSLQDKTVFEIYDSKRGIKETLVFISISDYEMYISDESTCGFLPKGKNNRYFRVTGPSHLTSLQLPLNSEVKQKTQIFWGNTVIGVINSNTKITIIGVDNENSFENDLPEKSIFIKVHRDLVNELNTSFYKNMGINVPDFIICSVRGDLIKFGDQKIE